MIEYQRVERTWKFSPLPATTTTAELYCSIAAMAKKKKDDPVDMDTMVGMIKVLPQCIARSLRDNHTEDEINAFIDSVVLDFGDPTSMDVLADLQLLFMGIDPATRVKDAQASA